MHLSTVLPLSLWRWGMEVRSCKQCQYPYIMLRHFSFLFVCLLSLLLLVDSYIFSDIQYFIVSTVPALILIQGFQLRKLNTFKYRVSSSGGKISVGIIYFNYLFFYCRPTHKLYFLSCRPFVVNATFSTGLCSFFCILAWAI